MITIRSQWDIGWRVGDDEAYDSTAAGALQSALGRPLTAAEIRLADEMQAAYDSEINVDINLDVRGSTNRWSATHRRNQGRWMPVEELPAWLSWFLSGSYPESDYAKARRA